MLTAMRKKFIASIFIFTFCAFTFGQNSNCPKTFVTGPSAVVRTGETMTFTANIEENGSDLSKINYQWSVDKGTIIEGQGTPTITVSTEGLVDDIITATVEVKGFSNDCVKSSTETGVVSAGGDPIILDEFGKLSRNDEKARLNALAAELMDGKEFIAYIILYHPANKKSYENKVARIKNYLVNNRGIPSERIVFIPGGIEPEERARIYLIPEGMTPPTP